MIRISKSRLMASLQCPKRVYLEVHRPELRRYSPATEAAFAIGHRVGEVAIEVLGGRQDGPGGAYVEYDDGLGAALAETRRLLAADPPAPIYEATLEHEGVLVREDLLLPTAGGGWRIVEVKASTSLKDHFVEDCAIQAWVHEGAGHAFESIALAHLDNRWVYPGGGDYGGLFVEEDLTDAVRALQRSVPEWVDRAREAVAGPMPRVPVGHQCGTPYECPFMHYCWPNRQETRYPVQGLGGGRKRLGAWVARGYRDIRDVPLLEIDSERQQRIRRVTTAGQPELLPDARRFVANLGYPRHYLDFEAVGPPVPLWPGTRPYQALPFQWSCHVERASGLLEHREFLDLTGPSATAGPPRAPCRALAERLIEALGDEGPVLMYTNYEQRIIETLIELQPDLAEPLQRILDRLVDLHPVVKQNYYHPDMLGSWSIKAVLPTIAPELDYAELEGINEGMAASAAYLEAIDPATSAERRSQIEAELLAYCRHDTEAMVRLVHFLGGA